MVLMAPSMSSCLNEETDRGRRGKGARIRLKRWCTGRKKQVVEKAAGDEVLPHARVQRWKGRRHGVHEVWRAAVAGGSCENMTAMSAKASSMRNMR